MKNINKTPKPQTKKKEMPDSNHDEIAGVLIRGLTYIIGIFLGLGAKLALLNKKATLTFKDFILHGFLAFACAWLVWSILSYYGRLDVANVASVIVGRYGDFILIAIWEAVKKMINNKNTPKL